jgi:hypothetical protein
MKKFLKRFEKLENNYLNLPLEQGKKVSRRFERLEVNDKKFEFSITDQVSPEEKAPSNILYFLLCPYCGQENPADTETCGFCKRPFEKSFQADYRGKANLLKKCMCGAVNLKERKNCWVCGRDFSLWGDKAVSERPENIITLNIDGKIYKSNDPELPQGIVSLMEKIRREGYSEKLVNEWMQEKNTQVEDKQEQIRFQLNEIQIGLIWRAVALVAVVIFIIFQIGSCADWFTS